MKGRKQGRMTGLVRAVALGATLAVTAVVVPDASVAPTDASLVAVERARGADLSPEVVWILAVGADARPGQQLLRSRGDALQLVGINSRTGAASAIGIPRDSYVDVGNYGRTKINAALQYGGPQLMADAVRGLVGIEPDYVMVAGFKGFENMIDDIGGITVRSRYTFNDSHLAPDGFVRGENRLNGYRAMAFSRVRKSLPGGDFDRSANQQRTLRGILGALRDRGTRPGFIESGVLSVVKNLGTNLSPAELFEIAQALTQVDPGKVTTCVVPGSVGYAGAASVVFPSVTTARRYGDDARRDATIKRC